MATKPRPKFDLSKVAAPASIAAPKPAPRQQPQQASRAGKRAVNFYMENDVWMQLKMVSVRSGKTLQDLMVEGVDLIFQQHGAPRIARD